MAARAFATALRSLPACGGCVGRAAVLHRPPAGSRRRCARPLRPPQHSPALRKTKDKERSTCMKLVI